MTSKTNNGWRSRIIGHGREKPGELLANPHNWKVHPDSQQEAVLGLMDEVGVVKSVIVNQRTGFILDGHLRVSLAIRRDEDEVDVEYVDLTEEEEALVIITLDHTAGMSVGDPEKLRETLQRAKPQSESNKALLAAIAKDAMVVQTKTDDEVAAPDARASEAEALSAQWGVKRGDVWEIGAHRLVCGDCTNGDDMELLLDGQRVAGVFTSPPYAMQRKATYGGIPEDEYVAWWGGVQSQVASALLTNGSFFLNIKPHADEGQRVLYVFDLVLAMAREWKWLFVDEFCWRNTSNGTPGGWPNRFKNAFEPVYHFSRQQEIAFYPYQVAEKSDGTFKYSPDHPKAASGSGLLAGHQTEEGLARPSNVIEVAAEHSVPNHPAPFPIRLPSFFMQAFSEEGGRWLDPFSGSGTVILAAEKLGRIGYGMELSEMYAAVSLQRFVDAGLSPVRVVEGKG